MNCMTQRLGFLGLIIIMGMAIAFQPAKMEAESEKKAAGNKSADASNPPAGTPFRKLTVTEPKTHSNLTVYLICAKDAFSTDDVVPLNEALEKKMIVVHETGDVNQLMVENVSDKTIFIHAGDIVRGGKQDRTLPNDMLLRPKSGKVPLASFCVEQGRWRARRGSSLKRFDSSANNAYGNKSKLAMRKSRSQRKVWRSVSRKQSSLSASLGAPVQSSQSESSLELTMDHGKVKEAIAGFEKAFKDFPATKKNSVGVAIVINGKIYCSDTYASHDLFIKIWPKLLKGSAIEAISHPTSKTIHESKPPTEKEVRDFLDKVRVGKKTIRNIDKNTQLIILEIQGETLFRTIDLPKSRSIHDSYVVEDENDQPDKKSASQTNDQIQLRRNNRRSKNQSNYRSR